MEQAGGHSTERKRERKKWPSTIMWTRKDVCDFICDVGYGKYANLFRRNAINSEELGRLTPYDLQRMGIINLEDAIRLHSIIQNTCNKAIYSEEGSDEPPNQSYRSSSKCKMLKNDRVPVSTADYSYEVEQRLEARLPTLPQNTVKLNPRDLRLPYRAQGDYYYRLPAQHYNNHCSMFHFPEVTMKLKKTRQCWPNMEWI